jgi:16S rRNA (guanine527-N7)-methyltransferase
MELLLSGARQLGIALTETHLAKFRLLRDELLQWNRRVNLTAITDPAEVETKHFLDSLSVVLAFPQGFTPGAKVLDIGSGPGFPGLPLAIVYPQAGFTLVEATWKKADFIAHAVKQLGLANVAVINDRSETLAHQRQHREAYAVVLARALAPLPALAELALPFASIGGMVIALKKGAMEQEVAGAGNAIRLMGGRLKESVPVTLKELNDGRVLVILEKVGHTPSDYPRRPGMPATRPIQ